MLYSFLPRTHHSINTREWWRKQPMKLVNSSNTKTTIMEQPVMDSYYYFSTQFMRFLTLQDEMIFFFCNKCSLFGIVATLIQADDFAAKIVNKKTKRILWQELAKYKSIKPNSHQARCVALSHFASRCVTMRRVMSNWKIASSNQNMLVALALKNQLLAFHILLKKQKGKRFVWERDSFSQILPVSPCSSISPHFLRLSVTSLLLFWSVTSRQSWIFSPFTCLDGFA